MGNVTRRRLSPLLTKKILSSAITGICLMFPQFSSAQGTTAVLIPTQNQIINYSESPRVICDNYKQRIAEKNARLTLLGIDSLDKENTCTHLSLAKGEIEDSHLFTYYILGSTVGKYHREVSEKVDVTNEIDLIIISSTNKTEYALFSNGNALLNEQEFGGRGCTTPVKDRKYCPQGVKKYWHNINSGRDLTASYGGYVWGDINNVFNNVSTQLSVTDIPGGNDNSRWWRKKEANPKTTADGVFSVNRSIGFSIGVSGSKGDGVSVEAGLSSERGTSFETRAMNVHQFELQSDLGSRSEFILNPTAFAAMSYFNTSIHTGGVAAADVALGEFAWRNLDFSSNVIWEETINAENCSSRVRTTQFQHDLIINRGQYNLDGTPGHKIIASSYDKYPVRDLSTPKTHTFTVKTQCRSSGPEMNKRFYRFAATGLLNG